jgi:tRNA pseudouridine13 synthase
MTFSLPAGVYATSVLEAILHTTEPDRHTGIEAGAVD